MFIKATIQERYSDLKRKMSQMKIGWLLVLMLIPPSSGYNLLFENETCSSDEYSYDGWRTCCPNKTNKQISLELFLYTPDLGNWVFGNLMCYDANSWWAKFEVEHGESRYGLESLVIVDCTLPEVTFAEIVRRLGFSTVKNFTFSSYMNLNSSMMHRHLLDLGTFEYLSLNGNGFTELPSDLLRNVTKIREVDLSFNEITTLPFDIFAGLRNLSIINLDYNRIKNIDSRVFENFRSLRTLYFKGNLLTTLSDRIFKDAGLSYLNVAENQLETLPNCIFHSTKRLILNISANNFVLLPEKLFDRVSITEIILSDNVENLTTLPNFWLSNLTELKTVVLARNALTVLPETIFWGDFQLEHVSLRANELSSIPADIFRDSKKLAFLDFSENELSSLPENLFLGLHELRMIILERNKLTSISENLFSRLFSLKILNLGFNSIATIHQAAFEDLLSLQVVSLSHNFVNSLGNFYSGRRRFREFSSLEKISLDHNHLDGTFDFNKNLHDIPANLRFVNVSHNNIQFIVLWQITAGSQDVLYDFRHNSLSEIIILGDSQRRIDILIDGNILFCGCPLYDILEYLEVNRQTQSQNNIRVVPGKAVCGEPSWMTSVYVSDVRLKTFACDPFENDTYVHCAERCECWWIPYNVTRLVNCTFRNLEEVPQQLIEFRGNRYEKPDAVFGPRINSSDSRRKHWERSPVKLDLADNSLVEIPPLNVSGYEYVDTLVLSRNKISKLSFDVLPPKLKVLDLDHNNLKRFDWVAWNALNNSATLKELNFEGNPWSCDSDTRRSLDSIEKKLGANLRYPTKKCLDYRSPPNDKKRSPLYISYTIF